MFRRRHQDPVSGRSTLGHRLSAPNHYRCDAAASLVCADGYAPMARLASTPWRIIAVAATLLNPPHSTARNRSPPPAIHATPNAQSAGASPERPILDGRRLVGGRAPLVWHAVSEPGLILQLAACLWLQLSTHREGVQVATSGRHRHLSRSSRKKLIELAQEAPLTVILTEDEASMYLQATTQDISPNSLSMRWRRSGEPNSPYSRLYGQDAKTSKCIFGTPAYSTVTFISVTFT